MAVAVACTSLPLLLSGCVSFGPPLLGRDQLGYTQAMADAEKRQTLLNIVLLRYGDTPTFLDTTQVISGYQLQRSLTGSFSVFPAANPSTFLNGGGAVQLQENPTVTFQPVTGENFAQRVLRPLSPIELLPLVEGGLPIDVLFHLAVQSVNGMSNAAAFGHQQSGAGSPDFFLLVHDLHTLQHAGLLSVRLEQARKARGGGKEAEAPQRALLFLAPTSDPALAAALDEARRLLGLSPRATEAEVVYGRWSPGPGQVSLLTRSLLGVLGQVALQVQVPPEDVADGRTLPTVGEVGIERRPVILVRSGRSRPEGAFTAVEYRGKWFWVDDQDFDSKLAFTMIEILLALGKTSAPPGTIITIPTR